MRIVRALAMLIAVVGGVAPGPADAALTNRLYLLATDQGEPYWSSDANDPELPAASVACGGNVTNSNSAHCLRAGGGANFLYFGQGALLDSPLALSAARPLRFHFSVRVSSRDPYTAHLALQRGTALTRSSAATQIAPGVFEGTLPASGSLDASVYTYFGVEIRTPDPTARVEVHTAGRSWVELPDAATVHSVPELRAQDLYRPAPSQLFTKSRSFRFNDADYQLHSFDVPVDAESAFSFDSERPSAALYAWVEGYDSPTVYDALRGEGTNATPTDYTRIRLSVNGDSFASGDRGSLADVAVPAGTLDFEVAPYQTHRTGTVKAHVLQVFGDRTLDSMRWRFYPAYGPTFNVGGTMKCFPGTEQVAATPATRTFSVSLGWDSPTPTPQRWTLSYGVPGVGDVPCGGLSSGPHARFTYPVSHVWFFGASPSRNSLFASAYDVRFEAEVRFTYAP